MNYESFSNETHFCVWSSQESAKGLYIYRLGAQGHGGVLCRRDSSADESRGCLPHVPWELILTASTSQNSH